MMMSILTKIKGFKNIIILVCFFVAIMLCLNKYNSVIKDLNELKMVKIENEDLKNDIKNKDLELNTMKEAYRNVNIAFSVVQNDLFELDLMYDKLLNKNKERNYVEIQKRKPKLAEKVYESSINRYYSSFFDVERVQHNDNTPKNKP